MKPRLALCEAFFNSLLSCLLLHLWHGSSEELRALCCAFTPYEHVTVILFV